MPHLCGPGPTCSFDPDDPPRLIFVKVVSSRLICTRRVVAAAKPEFVKLERAKPGIFGI